MTARPRPTTERLCEIRLNVARHSGRDLSKYMASMADVADALAEVQALAEENRRLEKGAHDALMLAMTRYTGETVATMITEAIAADRAMRGAS